MAQEGVRGAAAAKTNADSGAAEAGAVAQAEEAASAEEETARTELEQQPAQRWQAVLCKELPKLEEPESESAGEDKAADEGISSEAGSEAQAGPELTAQAEKAAETEVAEALACAASESATSAEAGTGAEEMDAGTPAMAPHGPAVLCKSLLRPNGAVGPTSESVSLTSSSTGTAQEWTHSHPTPSHFLTPLTQSSPQALICLQDLLPIDTALSMSLLEALIFLSSAR
jgi:hypothetical protein